MKKEYIKSFDGLRAIAVSMVILYHLFPQEIKGGYLGVVIFFVLSGYLVTDLLNQEYQLTNIIHITGFYFRRIKRLYPALIAMMFLIGSYVIFWQRDFLLNLKDNILSIFTFTNNIYQIQHGQSYFEKNITPSLFSHMWSLGVEAQFYLFLPFIFIAIMKLNSRNKYNNKNRKILGIIFLLLSLISGFLMFYFYIPGVDPSRVYYGTDTRIFSLVIGSALAMFFPSSKIRNIKSNKKIIFLNITAVLSFAFLCFGSLFLTSEIDFTYQGGMYLYSIISGILIVSLVNNKVFLSQVLSFPLFTWIGKRSYGMYLYQYPIMVLFEQRANQNYILEIFFILFISHLSYEYIEKKMQQPLKRNKKRKYLIISIIVICVFSPYIAAEKFKPVSHINNIKKIFKKNEDIIKEKNKEELKKNVKSEVNSMKITAIGDSVLKAVAPELYQKFPNIYIDAKEGRQMSQVPKIIKKLKQENKLANIVFFEIGSNGYIGRSDIAEVYKLIGKDRIIYFVNNKVPREWEKDNNNILQEYNEKYYNVKVINWHDYSQKNNKWFYDKIHPNIMGSKKYGELIYKAMTPEGELEIKMI